MEILAIFDIEGAFAQSRVNRYRHRCREHNPLGFRRVWKPQPALGQR
jgi:hypothetical protein